jgi:hypothetical protein
MIDTTKPYILCAAIWYKKAPELNIYKPRNIPFGIVLCGHRHHVIIEQYKQLTDRITDDGHIQGFLTSDNKFVTRKRALHIAIKAGQLSSIRYQAGLQKELYSEDIY